MIYKLTDGNQFLLGVFFQTGGGFGKVVRIQLLMIGKSCGTVFGQCDFDFSLVSRRTGFGDQSDIAQSVYLQRNSWKAGTGRFGKIAQVTLGVASDVANQMDLIGAQLLWCAVVAVILDILGKLLIIHSN